MEPGTGAIGFSLTESLAVPDRVLLPFRSRDPNIVLCSNEASHETQEGVELQDRPASHCSAAHPARLEIRAPESRPNQTCARHTVPDVHEFLGWPRGVDSPRLQ